MPSLSIIIPAFDAAATLRETVECLSAQSVTDWEVLIVDNGSTDQTGTLAAQLAAADPRIRVLSLDQRGVSAARNAGIAAARAKWLLFLDADDWLAADALNSLMKEARPNVDLVYSAWVRSYPDGHLGKPQGQAPDRPLFRVLVQCCLSAIHACLVRKAAVEAVGGFDPSLTACEDWDLWQRIARSGAHTRAIPDVLAYYRQRPGTATRNHEAFLRCGIEVIRRGHRPDPRVPYPDRDAANGAPAGEATGSIYYFAAWLAAVRIAMGGDAVSLLAPLAGITAPSAIPDYIAGSFYDGLSYGRDEQSVDWESEWPALLPRVQGVLDLLERCSGVAGLAMRVRRSLERRLLDDLPIDRPATVGSLHRVPVLGDRPVSGVAVPPGVDRLLGRVFHDGRPVTSFELPVSRFAEGALLTRVTAEEMAVLRTLPPCPHPISPEGSTDRLPVLMYHRVAGQTPAGLEPYCVSPERFDRQLSLLRRHGFHSITLEEWQLHRQSGQPLPGRPVLLTFDDGYLDFYLQAWPILHQHGMTATVFLVTDAVGQSAAWDAGYGTPARLMSWRDIHTLQREGISFGAHSATHRPLTSLTTSDLLWEGHRSRAVLQRELGHPVTAMAYPYGDQDEVVRRAMIDCGFEVAFTIESGFVAPGDRAMSLRRLDIRGTDDLDVFAATLGMAAASAAA